MTVYQFFHILTYPFVIKAAVAGICITLAAALLGVMLTLKNYSLIGHGLADVGFASLALALALNFSPLYVAIPVVTIASVIIMYVAQKKNIAGDTAIGIAASVALALGIVIASLSGGFNMDISSYMFGSILAVSTTEVLLSIAVMLVVAGVFIFFYNRLFLIACDESFGRSLNIHITRYQFLISILTAVTVVIGMRIMGTLLISSLIIFPAVTAKGLVKSFKAMVICSGIISVVCFCIGLSVSIIMNVPTGASIVLANAAFMLLAGLKKIRG